MNFLKRFRYSQEVSEIVESFDYESMSKILQSVLEAKLIQRDLKESLETIPSLSQILTKMESSYFTSIPNLKEYFRALDVQNSPQ